MKKIKFFLTIFPIFFLTCCTSTMEKLQNIGRTPEISNVEQPLLQKNYQPVEWYDEEEQVVDNRAQTNSLWQPGSRTFFKDQKARRVGDILKVIVQIKDKANFDNKTTSARTTAENLAAPAALGLAPFISGIIPGSQTFANLMDITGSNSHEGDGSIKREEKLETEIAAMVTQILPNGNLVIRGRQEIRVNNEIREITVAGIVRQEDVSAENSISTDQIAEARISYGGRGKLTDVQKPRIGSELLEIISPF